MNGKPGDHPVTDVLIHGLPAFSAEIDELIRKIHSAGGWRSEIAAAYMLDEHGRLLELGRNGQAASARVLISNLKFLLEAELRRLGESR